MTRETRLVVTLVAVSVAGITVLALVADQYRERMPHPDVSAAAVTEDAPARSARMVDGFLAARAAAHGVEQRYGIKMKQVAAAVTGDFRGVEGRRMNSGLDVISAYRTDRFDAFTAHGMAYDDYAEVRTAWRAWSAGQPVSDASLAGAFEARRVELEKAGLGWLESFDDAIK